MFSKHSPLLGQFEQCVPAILHYASKDKPASCAKAAWIRDGVFILIGSMYFTSYLVLSHGSKRQFL